MIFISLLIALRINPEFIKEEGGAKLLVLGLIADILAIIGLII